MHAGCCCCCCWQMLAAGCCWLLLLLLAAAVQQPAAAASSSSSSQHLPAAAAAAASMHAGSCMPDEPCVFLSPPIARPLKTCFLLYIVLFACCCFKTGIYTYMLHGMLLLQNRHACCMACCCFKTGMRAAWHDVASASATAALRACVRAWPPS